MALPAEINIPRMKGDGYPIVFNADRDYSNDTITLMTETENLSPIIVTAEQLTFSGIHFSSLEEGNYPYKLIIVSLGLQKTLVIGVVQIINDNLQVTP